MRDRFLVTNIVLAFALPCLFAMAAGCQQTNTVSQLSGASRIAHVSSLRELRNTKPIANIDGWLVRVGWSEPGEDASGWRNLYCHLEWKGEGEPRDIWTQASYAHDFGPLLFFVRQPDEKPAIPFHFRGYGAGGVFSGGRSELVYWANFPVERKGEYVVELYGKEDKPLARTQIKISSEPKWYWSVFARGEGKDDYSTDVRPVRAMPRHDGGWAVWKLKIGERPDPVDLDTLPCQVSMPARDNPPLLLAMNGKELVVSSQERLWSSVGLLGRWWVNGIPISVPSTHRSMSAYKSTSGNRAKLRLVLPEMLGSLRVGDKIGLQVLYVPRGMREPDEKRWPVRDGLIDWHPYPAVPLLSNRIEFTVIQGMLDGREEAMQGAAQ